MPDVFIFSESWDRDDDDQEPEPAPDSNPATDWGDLNKRVKYAKHPRHIDLDAVGPPEVKDDRAEHHIAEHPKSVVAQIASRLKRIMDMRNENRLDDWVADNVGLLARRTLTENLNMVFGKSKVNRRAIRDRLIAIDTGSLEKPEPHNRY